MVTYTEYTELAVAAQMGSQLPMSSVAEPGRVGGYGSSQGLGDAHFVVFSV